MPTIFYIISGMQSESLFINKEHYKLHLKRFWKQENAPSILLIHGSIEDGKIFYSKSGKGLAPFLAANGFDVFVADLRGRGKSTPHPSANHNFGHASAFEEDIPDFIEEINRTKGQGPHHLISHSWGGVHLMAYLAKNDLEDLKSLVFFGSKRDIRVKSLKKWWTVNVIWFGFCTFLAKTKGYLPARKYKIGSADEAKDYFLEVNKWVRSKDWKDHRDGFDYAAALQSKNIPPILSITGSSDTEIGHPVDCKRLLKEIGDQENFVFKVIGKKQGYQHDYDHINLLTHKDAKNDHFKEVLEWLKNPKIKS
ncbi:alpha/beta fold hydrolase [Marivirga arenosa]|uniref:Alpha/beta fold hydrolase n=1 Tax=Marivirga arenosa TaxID=3059076 RepID=A0AA51NA51_9BACT|nr:alpha/beta fold hydrolase [Marivirga sp. ABR2-2]WMN07320.1 alpha/beta fold hydrolase [Marivirga sp. ABR2-2]